MASVELKKVAKSYENSGPVIHGIDLKIKKGEFMVLVGPSGCGKSTTLRMIAGLEEVTDGELMINDKKVNDVAPKDRNIAMVFQNYALYPHMTVYENIAFGLKLAKLPKEEIDSRVKSVAKSLEIDHLLDRKPKNMSGGQRQRVALGRAIARRASVYLFDEPLSNLDAQLRVSMRVRLAQLNSDLAKQGLENTMIYVTHDQVEAMTLGHRICVMESGYIRQVDTPLNLYRYPANKFVAEFIGSPSMNFTQGILEKSSTGYEVNIKGYKCVIPKEKAVLLEAYVGKIVGVGVRAEHIHLKKDDPSFGFKGEISVVEHMGNEDFIYLKYNDTLFVCRSQDHINVVPEDPNCYFNFEPEHIHLFDLETEQNISLPESRITETTAPSTPDISNIEIIELLGGKSNIIEVNSCISRVRVIVKEDKNVKLLEMRKRGLNVVQAKEQHVHIVLGGKSKATAAEIFRQIQ